MHSHLTSGAQRRAGRAGSMGRVSTRLPHTSTGVQVPAAACAWRRAQRFPCLRVIERAARGACCVAPTEVLSSPPPPSRLIASAEDEQQPGSAAQLLCCGLHAQLRRPLRPQLARVHGACALPGGCHATGHHLRRQGCAPRQQSCVALKAARSDTHVAAALSPPAAPHAVGLRPGSACASCAWPGVLTRPWRAVVCAPCSGGADQARPAGRQGQPRAAGGPRPR